VHIDRVVLEPGHLDVETIGVRQFRASLGRITDVEDSVAERMGFEPAVPSN
jgi:hypothetical protein